MDPNTTRPEWTPLDAPAIMVLKTAPGDQLLETVYDRELATARSDAFSDQQRLQSAIMVLKTAPGDQLLETVYDRELATARSDAFSDQQRLFFGKRWLGVVEAELRRRLCYKQSPAVDSILRMRARLEAKAEGEADADADDAAAAAAAAAAVAAAAAADA